MNPPQTKNESTARQELLTRLVREHAALLYRVAYAVLRHAEDAEDAVQDALVKLLRARTLPEMQNERAFLARSVYRAALDRRAGRSPVAEEDEAAEQVADTRTGPEDLAADAEQQQLVHAWIGELPAELRETLLLSAVEGLNSREAAEVLGIPEATVRTRLHRARLLLRERAEQHALRRGRVEVAAATEGRR